MTDADKQAVSALLDGLSYREFSALAIDALRRCYAEKPDGRIQVNDRFGIQLAYVLAEHRNVTAQPPAWKEVFLYEQSQPYLHLLACFLWWLIRTGRAVPVSKTRDEIVALDLTDTGVALAVSEPGEHPLAPGFFQRIRDRCPGLPDAVLLHIEDVRSCLEHGLLRPAVMMLGLAFEAAVEGALRELADNGINVGNVDRQGAAQRINSLRAAIARVNLDRDDTYAAGRACDFADDLRRRRNDGSHTDPHFPFEDADEVEEMIVSAGRALPLLWSITTADPRQ